MAFKIMLSNTLAQRIQNPGAPKRGENGNSDLDVYFSNQAIRLSAAFMPSAAELVMPPE